MDASEIRIRMEADLRRARSEREALAARIQPLDGRIASLEAALGIFDEYARDEPPALGHGARPPQESVKDAAIRTVVASTEPLSAPELVDRMIRSGFDYDGDRDVLEKTVRGVLSRAHHEGVIAKPRRGLYGPPEMKSPEAVPAASGVAGPPTQSPGGDA